MCRNLLKKKFLSINTEKNYKLQINYTDFFFFLVKNILAVKPNSLLCGAFFALFSEIRYLSGHQTRLTYEWSLVMPISGYTHCGVVFWIHTCSVLNRTSLVDERRVLVVFVFDHHRERGCRRESVVRVFCPVLKSRFFKNIIFSRSSFIYSSTLSTEGFFLGGRSGCAVAPLILLKMASAGLPKLYKCTEIVSQNCTCFVK